MKAAIPTTLLILVIYLAVGSSHPPAPAYCTTPQGTVLTPVGDCTYFDLSDGSSPPPIPVAAKKCQGLLRFDTRAGICTCNWPAASGYSCGAIYPYVPTTTTTQSSGGGGATNYDPHTLGNPPKSCYTGDVADYYLTPVKGDCREFDITLNYDPYYVPAGLKVCQTANTKFDLRICACNHAYLVGPNCMSQP